MKEQYIKISIICFIAIFLILSYGTYRCKTSDYTDPLTYSPLPPPLNMYFDGWGISHFSLFFILGYLCPDHLIFSFILGVLWEVVEYSIKDRPFYLSKCNYVIDTDHGQGWWYGRWQDIVMNTFGLLLGKYMKQKRIFPLY